MASLNGNWFASSSTMLSRPAPQPKPQQPSNFFSNGDHALPDVNPNGPSVSIPMRPHAGRKRSRDEISSTDEPAPQEITLDRPPSPPKKPALEPIYGPGMTLIYPDRPGFAVDAASQSGTWVEEREETSRPDSAASATRPGVESRKSQRMNGDAPGLDDVALAVARDPQRDTIIEPKIDEATRTLGIGWKVMPDSMEAAARGWAKFIENHYPLQSVSIFWQNNSIPAYLASAVCYGAPGYYLFDEDLGQGRMVAKSWERALDNLRANPPEFDGVQVLSAYRANNGITTYPELVEHSMKMELD